MLVLTRKQRQTITIGDSIRVTILKLKGSQVRLGIDAPDGVKILRGELVPREAAETPDDCDVEGSRESEESASDDAFAAGSFGLLDAGGRRTARNAGGLAAAR